MAWGQTKLPNKSEVRHVVSCVESSAEEYRQAALTRPSIMRGPNARLYVQGDCRVGRPGIGGIGQIGKLEFRWVDRMRDLATGVSRNEPDSSETAATVEDMDEVDDVVEDSSEVDDEVPVGGENQQKMSLKRQRSDELASTTAVPKTAAENVSRVGSASNDSAHHVDETSGTSGSLSRLRKRRPGLKYK